MNIFFSILLVWLKTFRKETGNLGSTSSVMPQGGNSHKVVSVGDENIQAVSQYKVLKYKNKREPMNTHEHKTVSRLNYQLNLQYNYEIIIKIKKRGTNGKSREE